MNVDYSKYTVIQDGARIIGGDFVTVNGQPVAPDTAPPVFKSTDGTPLGKTPNGPGFSTPRGPPNATGGTPIYNSAGKVIRSE
ncbi:hypothetical protein CC1G_09206 [Coprinopsis cinerea okayama7|uniref:Uncharacterized protein n=1 Tax=Coprinopsis cinerea (strain Okayama-7 / 130 / ATCC MYA-4618 / FGSC 9003) TaxID=240176 RepID=A8P4W9_COPC7|nr:hypothetical protein CC1G_09206 [Coprinopsis cinerea okayama7\|eukprot:XP_001838829.2 hypothetical protein CC1G_09206 [Coprinopsis cinerea okayama7\